MFSKEISIDLLMPLIVAVTLTTPGIVDVISALAMPRSFVIDSLEIESPLGYLIENNTLWFLNGLLSSSAITAATLIALTPLAMALLLLICKSPLKFMFGGNTFTCNSLGSEMLPSSLCATAVSV
ncbi:hypothetical protein OT793_12710 [Edwardsiella ictaluri]